MDSSKACRHLPGCCQSSVHFLPDRRFPHLPAASADRTASYRMHRGHIDIVAPNLQFLAASWFPVQYLPVSLHWNWSDTAKHHPAPSVEQSPLSVAESARQAAPDKSAKYPHCAAPMLATSHRLSAAPPQFVLQIPLAAQLSSVQKPLPSVLVVQRTPLKGKRQNFLQWLPNCAAVAL